MRQLAGVDRRHDKADIGDAIADPAQRRPRAQKLAAGKHFHRNAAAGPLLEVARELRKDLALQRFRRHPVVVFEINRLRSICSEYQRRHYRQDSE
jgi:hypothetical protein